ncbi:response regulator [Clostridium oceanicum]|uniref:Transcriptional regulatory protein n=1 Tax=Clostridium oceanicum TaxID=1543 RepID=A0ABN1JDY2_9CLOT
MIKVLIIEDDPMVAEINKIYTEKNKNFEVYKICNNGADALTLLSKTKIDLIILDVFMPKMNGIEFLKKIREKGILLDVIIVTSSHDADKLDTVLKFGAIDYLIKPFKYERFNSALENFLNKHTLLNKNKEINQCDIDKLTKFKGKTLPVNLPKGFHKITLSRISTFMKNNNYYFTSEEVATKLNLSKVTTRKYLNYMEEINLISSNIKYGTIGRPTTEYLWNR